MTVTLDEADVNQYLQTTKFSVTAVSLNIVNYIETSIFAKLNRRYDTSLWVDNGTTPALVIHLMEMWYAGFYLRKIISEEDGLTSYADWLQDEVDRQCSDIASGAISLIGVTEYEDGAARPEFFPNDASTLLWEDNHDVDGTSLEEGASALLFDMEQQF